MSGTVPADGPGRCVMVMNPTAGNGRAGAELVRLRTLLSQRGVDAEIFLTRCEGDASRILRDLPLPPETLVVAVGGDGTVHDCGLALAGRHDVSLGVLPLGSGNDYAALLGMPKHLPAAVDAVLDGTDTRWDVGSIGPHDFLNSIGFALSARVSRESRHSGPLRGLPRYLWASLRALLRFHPERVGLDGLAASGDHVITLMEVAIGNRCGGGFRLTPRADPADGLLDVCLIRALPPWRLPLLLPRTLRGRHLGHAAVIYEQVPSFRLRLASDTLIHVDGELLPLARGEHSVRVRPRALRVRLAPAAGEPRPRRGPPLEEAA